MYLANEQYLQYVKNSQRKQPNYEMSKKQQDTFH